MEDTQRKPRKERGWHTSDICHVFAQPQFEVQKFYAWNVPALFVNVISKMTFDYGATVKNLTLTFWPKIFFEVNIHVEKPGKKFGTKSQC